MIVNIDIVWKEKRTTNTATLHQKLLDHLETVTGPVPLTRLKLVQGISHPPVAEQRSASERQIALTVLGHQLLDDCLVGGMVHRRRRHNIDFRRSQLAEVLK